MTELTLPTGGNTSAGCGASYTVFDTPDVTLNTSAHLGYIMAPGDSSLWLCADATVPNGNSYFTSTAYASPAIPFSVNWMLGVAEPLESQSLFINGGSSACITDLGTVTIDFFSGCPAGAGLIGLVGVSLLGFPPVYFPIVIVDDNGDWSVTVALNCTQLPFYPVNLDIHVAYLDRCDLQSNGSPRLKLSNTVQLTLKEDCACSCGPLPCFGRADDGTLDSTIWKVQNPAGSADWYNVQNRGYGSTYVYDITTIEVASWDFCSSTQSWARVGLFGSDSRDPTAGTPDLANPVTEVGGASATVPAGQSDWSFPATVYDIPDVSVMGTTTYHVAVQWQPGDTCIWLGSDTTGTADDGTTADCATIPGSTSFFSGDGYATNAVPFTTANWMMRFNWN